MVSRKIKYLISIHRSNHQHFNFGMLQLMEPCRLNHIMSRLGLTGNPLCRLCLEDDETAEHILCACSDADRIRFSTFGRTKLLPSDLEDHPPGKLTTKMLLNLLKEKN
ncbi:hypothetical protein JTB14_012670 [Gonioctena quinquepunctata]|nr:hypothetical protein JTB14_012670 [Gonioctena quinquepunctata]